MVIYKTTNYESSTINHQQTKSVQRIELGEKYLQLADFEEIIYQSAEISLSKAALQKVKKSFDFLRDFSKDKIIYGVNTGFGPMAPYIIRAEKIKELQYNLIRSHSAGTGGILSTEFTKAILLARLNSLMQGYSGIHENVVHLLTTLVNKNIFPVIFEHGGVGASGDLVQLAHLALTMIGEGDVVYENEVQPTEAIFKKLEVSPIKMYQREGLALINGTSAMTGMGVVNLLKAKRLLKLSILASSMINEIVEAYDDHFSKELNQVKHHEGQRKVAQAMRENLADSQLVRHRYSHLHQSKLNGVDKIKDKVQEYYSLRCVSQVLGPVWDTLEYAEKVVTAEINSANDNPIVDAENENIFHGGNFHGDYISLEMDKIKIAITKLSMLCERQLNYLLNDKLNGILPPFVNLGTLGLNFGMQGSQFTAVSTVAENQTMSNPMYIHSIPNNNDNQDIVSMGSNAALMAHKVIDNSFEVIAIEFMTILQAIEYLKIQDKMATKTRKIYDNLRAIFPSFSEDATKYQDIRRMKEYLIAMNFIPQLEKNHPLTPKNQG